MGPLWAVLDRSWAEKCEEHGYLENVLISRAGARSAASGAVLGRSWGLCGRSWAALGAYVGGLGLLLGLCGPSGSLLGPILGILGRSWGLLGAYVGGPGPLLGLLLAVLSRLGPKNVEEHDYFKTCLFLERERDLRPRRAVLGRSWTFCW